MYACCPRRLGQLFERERPATKPQAPAHGGLSPPRQQPDEGGPASAAVLQSSHHSFKSDVYSFGIVVWEILSGQVGKYLENKLKKK